MIWLVPNSEHKGILVHMTGEISPERSGKWPNKPKRLTKFEKLLKKVSANFSKYLKIV